MSGQQDYTLNVSHLGISRVEIKDQNGIWTVLRSFDESDLPDRSLTQLAAVPGVPRPYDVLGSSIFLDVPSNYSQAASLKLYFSRGPLYFSNTSAAYSYLCFHNTAGTPTAGASIFFKIGIPAGGAANVEFSNGVAFGTSIGISTVTGAADNRKRLLRPGPGPLRRNLRREHLHPHRRLNSP